MVLYTLFPVSNGLPWLLRGFSNLHRFSLGFLGRNGCCCVFLLHVSIDVTVNLNLVYLRKMMK